MLQNIIAPYRIRLFNEIAKTDGLDFKVLLTAPGIKSLPQWNYRPEDLPFLAERVPGLCFQLKDDRVLCFNPTILFKMFRDKPDVIICAGFSFATLMAVIYRLFARGRYIIWMEGTEYTEKNSFFVRTLRTFMLRFSSGLIDAGTLSRRYLKSLLPKKLNKTFFTSYNCVETERFLPGIASSETLEKLKEKYPPKNILFVGRLIKIKGILQLLEVYRIVAEHFQGAVGLIFVGQGPLESHIREFKEKYQLKNIFLEGFVNYQELPAYYWISDLLVNLGLEDRNPLVLFEGLSAGIPVLFSNRIGNALDFIQNGENGYIVNPFDVEDVAAKGIDLLKWSSEERIRAAVLSKEMVRKANYQDSAKAFVEACKYSLNRKGLSGCDHSVSTYQNI